MDGGFLYNGYLSTGTNEFELVEFWIKEELDDGRIYVYCFGLNVAKVREVIWLPEIIKIPNLPSGIEGVINLRGDVIPVVDLPKALSIREPSTKEIGRKSVIITQFYGCEVGIIVHEAKRIRRLTWDKLRSVPEVFSSKFGSKILGVVEVEENEFLLLLDIESLFVDMGLVSVKEEIAEPVKLSIEDIKGAVIVVDDSPVARKILHDVFEKAGFKNIVLCSDGLEAWEKIESLYNTSVERGERFTDKIAAVVTDIEMPNMDGYTLTKKIKDHPALKRIPVIVNTSLSGEWSSVRAKTVNADAFFIKFHPDEIVKTTVDLIKKNILEVSENTFDGDFFR